MLRKCNAIDKIICNMENVSEAFCKIIYIIRLFFANELSKSYKIYKLKSTSK